MNRIKGNRDKDSLYSQVWRKLKRNKPAMFGLIIILFAVFVSVLGSNIRPDGTKNANDITPSIARKNPGFKVKQLLVSKNREVIEKSFLSKLFFGGQERKTKRYPIYGYDFEGANVVIEDYNGLKETDAYEPHYTSLNIANVLHPLSIDREENFHVHLNGTISYWLLNGEKITEDVQDMRKQIKDGNIIETTFYLGTDKQGRDMLSRLMAGVIISLSVGLISVIISLILGVFLGALAGFYRGWVDDAIMWLINVIWSIPGLLLIISFTLFLGKGFTTVFIAVGFTMWVELARVVRGQILSIREKEYIEAGRALGFSNMRIIWKHILPNTVDPVIVLSAFNFTSAILIEAGLSFLGIGAQIPMASWGAMIEQHQGFITNFDKAYLAILPGVCIIFLVFAFMLLGNGLRDALDARIVDDTATV